MLLCCCCVLVLVGWHDKTCFCRVVASKLHTALARKAAQQQGGSAVAGGDTRPEWARLDEQGGAAAGVAGTTQNIENIAQLAVERAMVLLDDDP